MFLMRSQFTVVLAAAGLLWIPELSGAQDSRIQGQVAAASRPTAELAAVPRGEALVTYENATLTIASQGAPLIDVFRQACSQLRATLDAPSEANQPVVGIFGPGSPREVLASLLDGSQYELGTAASVENAQALVRVVVLSKSNNLDRQGTKNTGAANATAKAVTQPQPDSTHGGEKASAQEMVELLSEAKVNFVDNESDPEDPTTGIVKAQAGDIFKALEALVKTAATAEDSGASPQPAASQAVAPLSPTPRHRRR
jgi:hypothetical protein